MTKHFGVRTSLEKLERHMSKFIAAMDNSGGSAGGVLDPATNRVGQMMTKWRKYTSLDCV